MPEYIIKTTEPLDYRFNPEGELICSALGINEPDVYVPPAPASAEVPPWLRTTVLTTQDGPGSFFDLNDDEGDMPFLLSEGFIQQTGAGLLVPSGLAGSSPDGFWRLGDKSLADYRKNPAGINICAKMHKPTHTGAIAGSRLIGWAKSDFTAFIMVGLEGGQWQIQTLVNGALRFTPLSAAATGTPRFLHGQLNPSGTAHMKPHLFSYELPSDAYDGGDPDVMVGGLNSGVAANQDLLADWYADIGDGSDWFPYLRIDGYNAADDPWAVGEVHL